MVTLAATLFCAIILLPIGFAIIGLIAAVINRVILFFAPHLR